MKKNTFSDGDRLSNVIRTLIFGRLGLIFLLLLASWSWTNNYLDLSIDSFPDRLLLLFFVSIGFSVLYFLFFNLNINFLSQIRIQFLIDAFLITWLVAETGVLISPYVTLYIVLISVSGYFMGRNETLLIAVLSAACFSALSLLSTQSVIYSLFGAVPPSRFVQIIAFNTIGILIVGLLAGHLSERRKVTEKLKETEKSFENLHVLHERIIESIRSGLITTDLSGKIRTFNRAAEEILDLKADATIGGSVYSLFDEDIRPAVDLCLYRAAEGHEFPTEHFEAVGRAAPENSGGASHLSVTCSVAPLIGKTGMVTGLILTFQDVSEIRTMEESLRRSDRLAAVGRMAAGLAHEIRNPLGSIGSALQYLEENVKPETPEANLLNVVLRESDRLNKIISNFLIYSRLSAGGFSKDKFEPTDIGNAIRDCMVLLRHSPDVVEAHVFDSDLPEEPVTINANETEIKQVLWNIMQNSIQAMPKGGWLRVELRDFPGQNVRIVFSDTGCGMSADNLEHLFEPFTSGNSGAGLGLSIVHKIVRDHGGHIDVKSRESEGTKVMVELPH